MDAKNNSKLKNDVSIGQKPSISSKLVTKFRNNFQKPIKENKDWITDYDKTEFDEQPLKRYVPERLEILCEQTGLEKRQLKSLYRAFKQVCPNGAINEITFRNIYCQLFPLGADGNAYGRFVFKALDRKQTGSLTFGELVRGLACLVKGSPQERLHWIFKLYDINCDGKISRGEMSAVIEAIHDLIGPCQERSDKHTSRAFQKLDLNSDGVITMDEFMACCFNDEIMSKSFETFNNW